MYVDQFAVYPDLHQTCRSMLFKIVCLLSAQKEIFKVKDLPIVKPRVKPVLNRGYLSARHKLVPLKLNLGVYFKTTLKLGHTKKLTPASIPSERGESAQLLVLTRKPVLLKTT